MEGILFPHGIPEGREELNDYRNRGGYEALARAIRMPAEDVVQQVSDAGLRGRGGAGFPTGKKWAFTREAPEQPRYLIMNGGEDEPGHLGAVRPQREGGVAVLGTPADVQQVAAHRRPRHVPSSGSSTCSLGRPGASVP